MKAENIKKNIENLAKWLEESPRDEDYARLLKEYKEELSKLEKNK